MSQVFKFFILFLFLLLPNVSLSASFDCEKATTDTEKEICRDSFIVPFGEEDRLEKLMEEAFVYVTNKNRIEVKFNKNLTLGQVNQAKYSTGPDRDYYLDSIHAVNESVSTEGYSKELERHRRHYL